MPGGFAGCGRLFAGQRLALRAAGMVFPAPTG